MILSSSVPKSFYGEAIMTACYLTNMILLVALNGDMPYGKWYGKCSDYFMLRTFGCTAFSPFSHQRGKTRT